MEEITTRFEIVRLAVKMADHETVAVQAGKLRDISLDEDLNEIISLLESKNYRQALFLMKGYVNSLDDSFFNEPAPAPTSKKRKATETPQETQSLFDMMQPQVSKTINLDDMLRMTEESAEESVVYQEPERVSERYITQAKEEVEKNEAYLDIHKNREENKTVKPFEERSEEALSDIHGRVVHTKNVVEERVEESPTEAAAEEREALQPEAVEEITEEAVTETVSQMRREAEGTESAVEEVSEAAHEEKENFVLTENKEEPVVETEQYEAETPLEEEGLFETQEEPDTEPSQPERAEQSVDLQEEALSTEPEEESAIPEPDSEISLPPVRPVVKELDTVQPKVETEAEEESALKAKRKADYTKENRRYPPISYIDQKFRNMRHQFPQVEESENGIIDEVKLLLKQVATQGYTENDIRDAILFFQEKKAAGKLAEAAQMLLLAAASESKYAQLLLARELFKGEVLKTDYPESFTQINRLAEHDYPEAICDLAQLYEYGYGIKKDKKTAQLLYEEAAEMGVQRAQKHVERLSGKKGILSAFFK